MLSSGCHQNFGDSCMEWFVKELQDFFNGSNVVNCIAFSMEQKQIFKWAAENKHKRDEKFW